MTAPDTPPQPLAIVGIGCRFPGDGDTPERFWDLLCRGVDATGVVPQTRWNAMRFWDPHPGKVGKIVTLRGGFLREIDRFDPQFFGISPREAHSMDPQQRLLLEVTWEALEDGGVPADRLAGTDVGVFVGGFTLDYQLLQNQGRASRYRFKAHSATGMMMTMLANRISFAFDFRGPSMAVDTACSSSLVAVHLAAQSIWNGECGAALAGGVNVMVGPNTAIAESRSGFLSPEGRSKAFDDAADGYARGEGAAVVLIKPLAAALADGDDIYAQILGTAVSQDGRTDGITVPREEAQQAAITSALRRAGVHPGDVGYVEAHGTGTPVGDPIEMRALSRALAHDRPAQRPLLIGSVKTNIGHLEAGAGVAGLIKAAMVLKHGHIPATLHFRNPNRAVSLSDLGLEVPASGRPFPAGQPRIAGVNSFGFGGTNAHVVLAGPPELSARPDAPPLRSARPDAPPLRSATLLPLSARSEGALVAMAGRLADHLAADPTVRLPDLAYTLGQRRSHLNHRHTFLVGSIGDARRQLRELADGGQIAAERLSADRPKLAFVCSGMGPQWWGMCRGLLDTLPVFADSIARTDRELSRYVEWSLSEELRRDEQTSRMSETQFAQPANFAVQVALAEQLAHWGITPDAVIGHSAGEVAAHYLAGLLGFEQAVRVVYHRSRLQQRTSGRGRMLAVGVDAETLMQTLDDATRAEFGARVSVAAINSPSAVTVAGDDAVLDDIVGQLDHAQIFHRRLPGAVPYHTHYMDAIKDDLFAALEDLESRPAAVPLYSTVTGERLDGYRAGAAYWWQNTRATVVFEPAVRRMLDDGFTHFVELAPHPVLASSVAETAGRLRVSVFATQRRREDDLPALMNCAGSLYCLGHDLDWSALNPAEGARLLKLPTYPWQSKRFWTDTADVSEALFYDPVHPLLGQPISAVHPTWEAEFSVLTNPFLADHRVQGAVVVPGAVYVEMALAAARHTYGSNLSVDNLVLRRAVILDDTCDPVVRTTVNQDDGTVEFSAFTASADGEGKWVITATAELNALPAAPRAAEQPTLDQVSTLTGDEFYTHTTSLGFDYGQRFRSVTAVTAGHDWARADLAVPAGIGDELDWYAFHPALIDGAFQTLFGAPFGGQADGDEPFLPTRIRRCAVYGAPESAMTVHVDVLSATRDAIESNITISGADGATLAVFTGFTVQSLSASSRMSVDRIDKGLYELRWCQTDLSPNDARADVAAESSWLVLCDTAGFGAAAADCLRSRGHRVRTVCHADVRAVTDTDEGWLVDSRNPDHPRELVQAHLHRDGDLAGILDFWPIDIPDRAESGGLKDDSDIGALTVVRLVKSLAEHDTVKPRLHLITANAQPVPGTENLAVQQSPIWGLGRVIGHQEFAEHWGGLVDIDIRDDPAMVAARICDQVLTAQTDDQIALRGEHAYVPRLQPCSGLTKPFPTKLNPDATYVITGGAGALGRVVATYLADRGARHITLLGRSAVPPRASWASLGDGNPYRATVDAIRAVERLGAQVDTACVDVTDAHQVRDWLHRHLRSGGRPVRGIIHAAGVVDDQLLINMSDDDFLKVLSPKISGTWALHDAFIEENLDFFVLFGSAGSAIAAPGQANYAAANAFLDAFAHYRRSLGLPALTIGWGPWSVGMVEELKLEKIYAQRGIELITPAVGVRILDRLINQAVPHAIAISADWGRAREVGLGGRLPAMFSALETVDADASQGDAHGILDVLASTPEGERHAVVAEHVQRIVATVFDCGIDDFGLDDMLDDIGLDSMMAMEFRIRVNTLFSIDLSVLEILRGVSVNSLAARVLAELHHRHGPAETPTAVGGESDGEVDALLGGLSDDELRELLSELEDPTAGVGES
ncbi:type I polyketide synthase [Mycolicibacterium sp. 120266]|uniref:type I polyketide synthase n=1 Tax=Mycolicibacterium sp. 120266 TaxID=3090601 RepID=UPI00299E5706|nr:type I polyketide synthase [Mycolicibacterium sp. 120266]MDX1872288.1 type I polyketide synthase [Mycolicibacterium sp. 120266]